MNKKQLITDIAIVTAIATIISITVGFISTVILSFWKSLVFFQLPENAHFTEYNTPTQILDGFYIQGFQDPLTLIIMLIPFVFAIGFLWLFYKGGDYR